jgi:hypothetical protein
MAAFLAKDQLMKMLTRSAAFLFSAPLLWVAQAQAAKPTPQVQKLGYYVGTWTGHGETKGGPFGRAGRLSSHQICSWFAGGFQVICRGEERGPTGIRQFLNILAYDETTKAYTEYSISNRGDAEYDKGGTWVGNRLTFLINEDAGGKPAKFRYSETHVSPSMYTYRAEVALGGKPWAVLAEGEIKKVKQSR